MACPTDVRLVAQLCRGHAAFEDPAPGFTVVRVTPSPFVNMSELSPPSTFVLAAVRNLGSVDVDIRWSSCEQVWENCCKTTVGAWPAQPVPPLAGRCAMPIRSCKPPAYSHWDYWHRSPSAAGQHSTFLHAQGTFEFLLAERDPEDDSNAYTNRDVGLVLLPDMWGQWKGGHWGVFMQAYRPDTINFLDRDLLTTVKSGVFCGKNLLDGAVDEWYPRLSSCNNVADLDPDARREWNDRFRRFGGDWLLAPRHDMQRSDVRETLRERALASQWGWIACDLVEAKKQWVAAVKLQRAVKRSLADPDFALCRLRLAREYEGLTSKPNTHISCI